MPFMPGCSGLPLRSRTVTVCVPAVSGTVAERDVLAGVGEHVAVAADLAAVDATRPPRRGIRRRARSRSARRAARHLRATVPSPSKSGSSEPFAGIVQSEVPSSGRGRRRSGSGLGRRAPRLPGTCPASARICEQLGRPPGSTVVAEPEVRDDRARIRVALPDLVPVPATDASERRRRPARER